MIFVLLQRTRKAAESDEQTGDSTRNAKKAKKVEVHHLLTPSVHAFWTPSSSLSDRCVTMLLTEVTAMS